MGDLRRGYKRKLMREANSCDCVCEKLRTIYDVIHEFKDEALKEELTEKLVDAFVMVKKMHDRLGYYQSTYEPQSDEKPTKLRYLPGRQERLEMRRKRKA